MPSPSKGVRGMASKNLGHTIRRNIEQDMAAKAVRDMATYTVRVSVQFEVQADSDAAAIAEALRAVPTPAWGGVVTNADVVWIQGNKEGSK